MPTKILWWFFKPPRIYGKKIMGLKALLEYNQKIKFDNSLCFVENSTYPRHRLKERIIKQKLIDYNCEICGNNGIWLDKPLPLILDHKNGVNNDNRLENLRFLCSNCDSQLPTYKNRRGSKGKNKGEMAESG